MANSAPPSLVPTPRVRHRGRVLIAVAATVTAVVVSVTGTPGAAEAGSAGATERGRDHGRHCTPDPAAPKHQMRGAWIASVANIDWPSRPGLTRAQAQQELIERYEQARAYGLNTVFVQIRPTADTFWPSDLEPWSHWLTGEQGADPGWDPTRFAVRAAHARGLDFHAWFNPYRVTLTGTDPAALSPEHPGRQHPDWLVAYGGKLYYDPGVPAAREHTVAVIMEAVRRYDFDGVHFDDYFYPYPVAGEEFDDADTFAQYGGDFADIEDWRRDNVTTLIRELDEQIHAAKPEVAFGVSPFAVWRNEATDPEGSATTAGAETYDDLYADTRTWVREELVDYVVPQVYWAIGFAPAAYDVLVPWWSDVVSGTDVDLWIGQATYKVGTSTQSPEWSDPEEMVRHLDLNRQYPETTGDVYFSIKDVAANRLEHMDLVQAAHYQHPALPPVNTDARIRVQPPAGVRVRAHDGEATVRWNRPRGRHHTPDGYAVYRLPAGRGKGDRCDLADATHLVAVLGPQARSWTDTGPTPHGRYAVTAIGPTHTESAPRTSGRGR